MYNAIRMIIIIIIIIIIIKIIIINAPTGRFHDV